MKLSLDPSFNAERSGTPASIALTDWYASRSAVRRLWAIEDSQIIRVIVTLEPTHDGNDTHPVWIANRHA